MKQRIILKIIKWLIEYVPDHHVARNGGKKKIKPGDTVTMNTDGKIIE